MSTRVKLRKNKDGLIIQVPEQIILEEELKIGEEVVVEIHRKRPISEAWGLLRGYNIDSQGIKNEIRKEEWNR